MNPIHSNPGFAKGLRPVLPERDHLKFNDFLVGMPIALLTDIAPSLSYPMDGNDSVGDCVVAMWDHLRQVITQLLTGTGLNFTQDEIWAFYKTQNPGFDPNGTAETNGPGSSSDNGMNIQLLLEYLQKNGYILGFAKVDHTNPTEVKAATYIGLALAAGVTLQQAQMDQFSSGQPWTPVAGSPIDGGHGVPFVGYWQSPQDYTLITWAKLQQCTQEFMNTQVGELWFVLTQYHVDHPNFRDNFDLAGFSKAVAQITQGQLTIPTPMPNVTLTRTNSNPTEVQGTFAYGTAQCFSLERPWFNNETDVSCIPPGTYQLAWTFMPDMNAYHYEVLNVPGRSGIFIHPANQVAQVEGCIALGTTWGELSGDTEPDVLNSRVAIEAFEIWGNKNPLILTITGV